MRDGVYETARAVVAGVAGFMKAQHLLVIYFAVCPSLVWGRRRTVCLSLHVMVGLQDFMATWFVSPRVQNNQVLRRVPDSPARVVDALRARMVKWVLAAWGRGQRYVCFRWDQGHDSVGLAVEGCGVKRAGRVHSLYLCGPRGKCAFLIPATRLTEPQGPLVSWGTSIMGHACNILSPSQCQYCGTLPLTRSHCTHNTGTRWAVPRAAGAHARVRTLHGSRGGDCGLASRLCCQ